MSDREMRDLLRQVMAEVDAGRYRPPRVALARLAKYMSPALVAAAMGLAGCDSQKVGTARDASQHDAAQQLDAGNIDPYGVVVQDAGPQDASAQDAGPQDADIFDARPDSEPVMPYASPPPIEPTE